MLLTERPTILSLVWKTGWAGTPSGCDVTGLLKLCWETKVCKRGNMNNAGWSAGCLLRSARAIQPLLLHCLHRSTPQWPSTAQPPCVFMPSYVFSLNCGFVALLAWRAASMKAWKRGEPKPKPGFTCLTLICCFHTPCLHLVCCFIFYLFEPDCVSACAVPDRVICFLFSYCILVLCFYFI